MPSVFDSIFIVLRKTPTMTVLYPARKFRLSPGNYARRGRDPYHWAVQADNLHDAAIAVFKQIMQDRADQKAESMWIDDVYKYLVGITLENLLKAIMIRDDKSLVSEHELHEGIRHHDMWRRQKDNKLKALKEPCNLSQDEQDFLKIAESYVVWMGRYPIPTTEKAYRNDLDATEAFEKLHPNLEDFNELFNRVYYALAQLAAGVDRSE
jgi:hypothetical protein